MARRRAAVAAALGVARGLSGCVRDPGGPGTRDAPQPVGVAVGIGSYEIACGATVADADAVVAAEDATNRPPADGRRFVLVPLQLTYRGTALGEPWLDLDVRYVTRTGAMYGEWEADQCGSVPGSLEWVDQMPPGTTAWGTACVSVPVDEIPGGVWIARHGGAWGWHGFFAASPDAPTVPGSFAAPTPAGESGDVGPYSVVLGPTSTDAFRLIRGWDENSAPPAAGRRYVLVPVTLTFHGGSSSGEPWADLAFRFVAADGTTFGAAEEDTCGDIPDAVEYAGVLTPEQPVTGNVCVSVPTGLVDGGRWHVVPEGTAFVWAGHFGLA